MIFEGFTIYGSASGTPSQGASPERDVTDFRRNSFISTLSSVNGSAVEPVIDLNQVSLNELEEDDKTEITETTDEASELNEATLMRLSSMSRLNSVIKHAGEKEKKRMKLNVTVDRLTKRGLLATIKAGVLTGIAVFLMHNMGILSTTVEVVIDGTKYPVTQHWDAGILMASLVIAVMVSLIGLFLIVFLNGLLGNIICSFIVGLAVCGMHYTGMLGVTYSVNMDHAVDRDNDFKYNTGDSVFSSHQPPAVLLPIHPFWISALTSFCCFLMVEISRFRAHYDRKVLKLAFLEVQIVHAAVAKSSNTEPMKTVEATTR